MDAANRLLADDQACHAYDANGNLTEKTAKIAGACSGPVTLYQYDAQDQLIRITFPDQTEALYRYDALGRRIEKAVDGQVTRYVYDGEDIVLQYDGANSLIARYAHGAETDQPLVLERASGQPGGQTWQSYFYHADHLGSIRKITDAAGNVVNSYDYDAYGRVLQKSETIAQPYTFTGREYDTESGLLYD